MKKVTMMIEVEAEADVDEIFDDMIGTVSYSSVLVGNECKDVREMPKDFKRELYLELLEKLNEYIEYELGGEE